MISGATCRMARAAVHMTQQRLAALAGISVLSLRSFEQGGQRLHVKALGAALRAAGAEFDSASGKVWLKRTDDQTSAAAD
jgi:transcriptional regulator with XRE-family HTH domain